MRSLFVCSLLWTTLGVAACSLDDHYPEGRIACASDSECPSDWTCRAPSVGAAGLCYRAASALRDAGNDELDAQLSHDAATLVDASEARDASELDASVQDQDAAAHDADTRVVPDTGLIVPDAGPIQPDASTVPVPKVDGVVVGNRYLNPMQQTPIQCLASDPNMDTLSYAWTSMTGGIVAPAQRNTSFTAGAVGPTNVRCRVTNTQGGSASGQQSVRVYPSGWLTLLRFSLDASDLSGHQNDGLIKGGSYGTDRAGNTGSALQLDGTGSITLANENMFELDEWSFVATLNPTPGHGGTLISKGDSAYGSFTLLLYADNDPSLPGRLQYYQASADKNGGSYSDVLGTFSAKGNNYFQLAVTRSKNGTLSAYVDGSMIATVANLPATVQNSAQVLLGTGPLGPYAGVIDEVQIYDRALTSNEVMALVGMQ